MKFLILAILMASIQNNYALADNNPLKIPTSVDRVYIPEGFDDNDNVQIVGEGIFPNSCYRPADSDASVDQDRKEIILNPMAYKYIGYCLQVLLPFQMSFQFGPLKEGTYQIKQSPSGPSLGALKIHRSTTSEPDDYLYAPVNQAFLSVSSSSVKALLTGDFPLSCMKMKEIKFQIQHDVIIIQPLAEIDSSKACTQGSFPFSTSVDLNSIKSGKYLLHIRSMNGKSVNSLVKIP